ncbi:MAG: hypothetical protein V4561_07340 [Bacteroidota bacterium]
MKKTLLSTFIACLIYGLAFGQQSQSTDDPFYYQVAGLVYVKEFNAVTRAKTITQKIPKEPLKFKIVSKETDATDNSTYYVVQFLNIADETGNAIAAVAALKSSTTFINSDDNNKFYWIRKDELDNYMTNDFVKKSYRIPNLSPTYGANISLPFKLRPKTGGQNIKITPDLTLGGYLGARWRLSHKDPFYLSFPVVSLGLSTLTINDNNNSSTTNKGDGTVLGITGSWGAVFQLKDFQFGLIMGWDRAAGELGKDWIYNDKPWYSFSIGFSFLGNNADKDKEK